MHVPVRTCKGVLADSSSELRPLRTQLTSSRLGVSTLALSEAGLTLINSVCSLLRRACLLTDNRVASVINNGSGQSLN